jgi:hypothetical protein
MTPLVSPWTRTCADQVAGDLEHGPDQSSRLAVELGPRVGELLAHAVERGPALGDLRLEPGALARTS